MDKWRGKTAVVTGASSGIGAAIVKEFAKNGINVIGLARRSEKVEEIADECKSLSGKIYARKCDVSDLNSIKEAFKWIEEKFSTVQILINNAGTGGKYGILDTTTETTDRINNMMNTNLMGVMNCARYGVELMNKSEDFGMIVNVGSILDSVLPFGSVSTYGITKHAVRAFSEIIRQELIVKGNEKIRVTNLSPGLVATGIFETTGSTTEECLKGRPYLKSEDIAAAILHILETPYNVNISQLTIKPTGEKK